MRVLLLAGAVLAFAPSASAAVPRVLAIHFDAEVNPVTQNYLCHNLSQAAKDGYAAAVIVLDTPGGLLESKDKIVLCELNAKLPVLVWVGPDGATAGSAGVWIAQAADYLGMAPQTNIGSSTPIDSGGSNIGSDLRRKLINHEAASLRALAQSHGRNVRWADRAVRVATNATAEEALKLNVIEAVAPTIPSLLEQSDGVKTKPKGYTLHLAGAQIHDVHLGFFTRLLNTLIDPNILPLLFLAGLAGIGFEIFHPGVVLPGALGAVALVTALFGFSVLPISWGGVLLMLLGVALLVVDVHVPTHGALRSFHPVPALALPALAAEEADAPKGATVTVLKATKAAFRRLSRCRASCGRGGDLCAAGAGRAEGDRNPGRSRRQRHRGGDAGAAVAARGRITCGAVSGGRPDRQFHRGDWRACVSPRRSAVYNHRPQRVRPDRRGADPRHRQAEGQSDRADQGDRRARGRRQSDARRARPCSPTASSAR